jgi:phage-related protein
MRIGHDEGPFRIVYCFRPGRRIVLLHGFVKRTEQLTAQYLELAAARKAGLS